MSEKPYKKENQNPLFKTPPPGNITAESGKVETPEEKLKRIKELEARIKLREGLPFLHGWKWYSWARAFFESTNPINLLCAANQISKSSTQIRKAIEWATNQDKWPDLWTNKPKQFWYLYPTKEVVDMEFETKWKLFLPQNGYEDDPYYGWRVIRKNSEIKGIRFNSGVTIYFRTYAQDVMHLQTGTCDAIFCDEELPKHLYDELMFRISASNGYFHMVFTATIGQDFWRRAMEPEAHEKEELAHAFKQTVSMYDCMYYEDGTPSQWTQERIEQVKARCSTEMEILKRVFGRFILLEGRKYESFDIRRHMKKRHQIPSNWLIFGAADPGSGDSAHEPAVCFVAVRPDFKSGRVIAGWRGDDAKKYTAGDCVKKYKEIKEKEKIKTTRQFYDWSSRDFYEIALSNGESFEKAEKSHEIGEQIINTLFKHDMLYIYEDEETAKLAGELSTLKKETLKRNAKDNFSDALRYAVTKIPWDWSDITSTKPKGLVDEPEKKMNANEREVYERRKAFYDEDKEEQQRIDDEFNEWNDHYGN